MTNDPARPPAHPQEDPQEGAPSYGGPPIATFLAPSIPLSTSRPLY